MVAIKAGILKRLSTPAGISELLSQVGGCPRDIIRLLDNRKDYQADVESAVQHLKDACTPAAYMTYPPFSDKLFHLVLLQSQNPTLTLKTQTTTWPLKICRTIEPS